MTAPPRDTTQVDGVIFGLPMAVLAIVVLVLLGPALAPALRALSAEASIDPPNRYEAVARGASSSDQDLAALSRALRDSGLPENVARAGHVQLIRAQIAGVRSLRAQQLATQAIRDLKLALAVAPSDTHAWMQLAVAHYLLLEMRPAAAALAMSLRTRKSDPALQSLQRDLAVILRDQLDDSARSIVERLKADAERRRTERRGQDIGGEH